MYMRFAPANPKKTTWVFDGKCVVEFVCPISLLIFQMTLCDSHFSQTFAYQTILSNKMLVINVRFL